MVRRLRARTIWLLVAACAAARCSLIYPLERAGGSPTDAGRDASAATDAAPPTDAVVPTDGPAPTDGSADGDALLDAAAPDADASICALLEVATYDLASGLPVRAQVGEGDKLIVVAGDDDANSGVIEVVDISPLPGPPQLIHSTDLGASGHGAALAGELVVAADEVGVKTWSITEDTSLLVDATANHGQLVGVGAWNGSALVPSCCNTEADLKIFLIGFGGVLPEEPTVAVDLTGEPVAVAVMELDDPVLALVAAHDVGVHVVDLVSNRRTDGIDTTGVARDVAVSGSIACVADSSAGLQLIEFSNPESPQLAGSVGSPAGISKRVAVLGNLAFVGYGGDVELSGLQVVDIANPEAPVELAAVQVAGLAGGTQDVAAVDGTPWVFLAGAAGRITVFDVSCWLE